MRLIHPLNDDAYEGMLTIELTRRNLEVLLAKLDEPSSVRTIHKGGLAIRATHEPHEGCDWGELCDSLPSTVVVPVENEKHYSDRPPGPMYMPSTDSYI